MPSFFEYIQRLSEAHERLKHRIHNGWRYPLPPWGRAVMGGVYCSIPVVSGWYIMQWAISKAHENIGEQGEKLKIKEIEGIGDRRYDNDGSLKKVGDDGFSVKLAVSSEKNQRQNSEMLEAMFRKERKRLRKREKMEREAKEKAEMDRLDTGQDETSEHWQKTKYKEGI